MFAFSNLNLKIYCGVITTEKSLFPDHEATTFWALIAIENIIWRQEQTLRDNSEPPNSIGNSISLHQTSQRRVAARLLGPKNKTGVRRVRAGQGTAHGVPAQTRVQQEQGPTYLLKRPPHTQNFQLIVGPVDRP